MEDDLAKKIANRPDPQTLIKEHILKRNLKYYGNGLMLQRMKILQRSQKSDYYEVLNGLDFLYYGSVEGVKMFFVASAVRHVVNKVIQKRNKHLICGVSG